MPKRKFTAKLYRINWIRWVDLPKAAVDKLKLPPADIKGGGKGWNALLRFKDDVDRVTLLPGKRAHYKVAIKVEFLKGAGVDAGDSISFTLEPDAASREPELPEEMRRAFQDRPQLEKKWLAHSVAIRRQVLRYIEQGKTEETVAKRCWLFLDRLEETGKLGGDG
jgi:Bacteriocin-protection, YdeI or OmpD-Associated